MVFDGSSVLLYGGVASLTEKDAAVFAGSWTWDGQHWTQRQDIGPGPRWGHAIAFDDGRGCTVLYGGASVAPADTTLASHLLGDTWEEQGTAGAPTPAGVIIAAFTVAPLSVSVGERVNVVLTVTLSQPSPAPVKVLLSNRDNIAMPNSFAIAAGQPSGQAQFDWSFADPGEFQFFVSLGGSGPRLRQCRAVITSTPPPPPDAVEVDATRERVWCRATAHA